MKTITQEPKHTSEDSVEYKGRVINLIGKTYEKPIMNTAEHFFYSIIEFRDAETNEPWETQFLVFKEQLTEPDYRAHFEHIKKTMPNYEHSKES